MAWLIGELYVHACVCARVLFHRLMNWFMPCHRLRLAILHMLLHLLTHPLAISLACAPESALWTVDRTALCRVRQNGLQRGPIDSAKSRVTNSWSISRYDE